MKLKYTFILSAISIVLFLIEITIGLDLIEYIYGAQHLVLDSCFPVILLSVIGVMIDYAAEINRRKEQEKILVYQAAVKGANNVLRNLMHNMQILSGSEAVRKEFGSDLIGILEHSIQEGEQILTHLSGLTDITPQLIQEISESKANQPKNIG